MFKAAGQGQDEWRPSGARRLRVRRWCGFGCASLAVAGAGMLFHPVVVQGESMSPTLRDGQCIWVDYSAYRRGRPRRGDVVVVRTRGKILVKRVYRGPSETFHCVANGTDIIRPVRPGCVRELRERMGRQRSAVRIWKVRVPDDAVFVMGDNVERSEDSRTLGTIPVRELIGRAWLRPEMQHLTSAEALPPPPAPRIPPSQLVRGD